MMLRCEILKPSLYSTHSMQRYSLTSFKKTTLDMFKQVCKRETYVGHYSTWDVWIVSPRFKFPNPGACLVYHCCPRALRTKYLLDLNE